MYFIHYCTQNGQCCKVNKCVVYVDPHQRPYFRYKCILFINVLRIVKALDISECCKVNKSILYSEPHQNPFFYKNLLRIFDGS